MLAPPPPQSWPRTVLRWLLAAAYLIAGIAHLRSPAGFMAITPHWVPATPLVVMLTGVAEIAGALALALSGCGTGGYTAAAGCRIVLPRGATTITRTIRLGARPGASAYCAPPGSAVVGLSKVGASAAWLSAKPERCEV